MTTVSLHTENTYNLQCLAIQGASLYATTFAMDSIDNPLHRLSSPNKHLDNIAEPLKSFADGPITKPVESVSRVSNSTAKVVENHLDPRTGPHSAAAQKIVLAKGIFDVFLSLSLIFFPSLLYDGPIPKALSFVTGLSKANWDRDTSSAFALSSLIMGCGFAGIVAGESTSDDAYKVVAALNGVFAVMSLIGSVLHPHKFGSSFLFLAALQDVFWFTAIVRAGNYEVLDTLGLSFAKVKKEADNMAGKAAERYAANGAEGYVKGTVRGVQGEGERVMTSPFKPQRAQD